MIQLPDPSHPRIAAALQELKCLIAARYPQATFEVEQGWEPPGVYLLPRIDVEDSGEVFDLIVDLLVDMQVHEDLPVYVTVLRPKEHATVESDR